MATTTQRITAEEYARLPDPFPVPVELERGRVVELYWLTEREAGVRDIIRRLVAGYSATHAERFVVLGLASMITRRNPDTVRIGEMWVYERERLPQQFPWPDYMPHAPDVAFEIKSCRAGWGRTYARIGELLEIGTPIVCVVDPAHETVRQYFADSPSVILTAADELTFPNQLPGFSVLVQRLFE